MTSKRLQDALPSLLKPFDIQKSFQIAPLAGDASNRSFYRLTADETHFIVMELSETGIDSPAEEITKTSKQILELPYIDVGRYLLDKGVRVPKTLGYDKKQGVLLIEDLGDKLLLSAAEKADQKTIKKLYESSLDELEKLSPIPDDDPRNSIAFARSFDHDLYHWEFLHFVEYGLDKRLKKPPAASDRKRIVAALEKIIGEYLSWDSVFCHRDYHSRNLLVLDDEKIGVIDFQDALLAPLFYDLASLLRDSYVALEENLKTNLVENYRQRLAPYNYKAAGSQGEFRRAFDLMGIHRNLKAAGRFCYIDVVKKNPNYLADVPRTLTYVKETLERYEDLRELKECLLPYLPEVIESCRP